MHILIIGGTVFLGRHLVEAALSAGHTVTLFNRGQHNPELFPEVEKLRGDRNGDHAALAGRHFDAAIDTSGYVPRAVRSAAEVLAPNVGHYTFISSISVYPTYEKIGIDESDPLGRLENPDTEEVTGETYGPLKVLCEQAAEAAMPGRTLIIRPGLIVGPNDPTDRFTYWPVRVARGGPFVAPEHPGYLVQVIDVRDLAEWTLRMVEAGRTGVYNATGPSAPLALGELLETCRTVSGSDATPVWVSAEQLQAHAVQPWMELPLWVPEGPQYVGFSQVSIARATDAGLTFRPIATTIADTLSWAGARPADHQWRAGLPADKEASILAALAS